MNCFISPIHYYPVKSLSFSSPKKSHIRKNFGILNDRIFCLSRNIEMSKAKLIEEFPKQRKLNNFLTLKNSPVLNKYKFFYEDEKLSLFKEGKKIISISADNYDQHNIICKKLLELEQSLIKPIYLLKNEKFPFFDTTHSNKTSNTISLININSIKDFEKKTGETIEFERFRGNLYITGIDAWEERKWVNKVIKVNKVSFKVQKNIARCSAINLKPNSDNVTINLPLNLNKYYNHIDMGLYITPLDDGEINIGDLVILDE